MGWSQDDLAERAGVSKPTIGRLESQDGETVGGRQETGAALIAALEKAGVEFIAENGGGAGVRMRRRCEGNAKRAGAIYALGTCGARVICESSQIPNNP